MIEMCQPVEDLLFGCVVVVLLLLLVYFLVIKGTFWWFNDIIHQFWFGVKMMMVHIENGGIGGQKKFGVLVVF